MPLTAQNILDRASKVIQDTTNVRWPVEELLMWLNDGRREIILHRPDSNPSTAFVSLVAGSYQKLVTGTGNGGVGASITPAKLMDVVCNYDAAAVGVVRRDAVRLVQREVLDAQSAAWHTISASNTVKHYMVDPRDPLAFYVYPAVAVSGSAKVEVLFSYYPADITVLGSSIILPDIYGNALLDYVLYRAYSKDSEYAGSVQRAQFHYQSFATSMQIELQGTVVMGPTLSGSIWNPNSPKGSPLLGQ